MIDRGYVATFVVSVILILAALCALPVSLWSPS